MQEVSFNLTFVKEITQYIVSLSGDDDDEFIFTNPQISTDKFTLNFNNIDIEQNNDPKERWVVISMPGAIDVSFAVEFVRPNQAGRFRTFKVIERIIIINFTYLENIFDSIVTNEAIISISLKYWGHNVPTCLFLILLESAERLYIQIRIHY